MYEPELQENGEMYWYLRRNPSEKLENIMTIEIYKGHAFLIKDITKLAKTYACNNCQARFTKACNLQRHAKTCSKGRTIIECPNEKVKAPPPVYERTFYNVCEASQLEISWLEKMGKQLGIHIHHAMCGNGGEGWILRAPVDGYATKSGTIFQYHGCWWHGCLRCFADRNTRIAHGKTREELYTATVDRTRALRKAGYSVIEKWECDDIKTNEKAQKSRQKHTHETYPG